MAIKTIATNRRAYHDYFIGDSVEAGIVLSGTEIKSVRAGAVNMSDAYVKPDGRVSCGWKTCTSPAMLPAAI